MKRNILASIIIIVFLSCSTTNDSNMKQTIQNWQLVKMTGSVAGSETTGSNMLWQERYELKLDNIFIKTRQENNNTIQASGTFKYVELADGMYLELTYPSENKLIGNCTGDLKEFLRIISEKQLQGTWFACDGPGLEYKLATKLF